MTCPYIGTFNGSKPARNQPNVNNVCHARLNPNWAYSPVDTSAQDHYCFSRSHVRCPRFRMIQSKDIAATPVAAAPSKGFLGLFRKSA